MNHGELTAKDAPSLESVHEMKLEALLHDLVKKEGKVRAARTLGVNYKTVARSVDAGRLSVHLREALMTRLLEQGETDADESEDGGAPERTVEALMEELFENVEDVQEELGQRLKELEGRLERVEGDSGGRLVEDRPEGADVIIQGEGSPQQTGAVRRPPPRHLPSSQEFRTTRPSVITMEPQPGDEAVFGAAWPLVDEWRRLRERHPTEGKGVSWLTDEERLRELEIALVGEHGLTMPPDTDPWDSLSRRTQVRWRTQTLERVHRERVLAEWRRRTRRILTLGMWRQ